MSFRIFCVEIWYQHKEEVEAFSKKLPDYDSQYYFNKYKWWLRREYKHRKGKV